MKPVIASLSGLVFVTVLAVVTPTFAATPYDHQYDPVYDSGVVTKNLTPQGVSLGDALFGKSQTSTPQPKIGGFLSSLKLRANASTAAEYTDNVKLSDTARKSDIANTTSVGVAATSDWDRHALNIGVNGTLKRFKDSSSENQDGFHLFANGKVDINDAWSLTGNLVYGKDTLGRDDQQEVSTTLSKLRDIENMGGAVGLNYNGYPFSVFTNAAYNHIVIEKMDNEALGYRDRDVYRYSTRISYPVTDDIAVYVQPALSHEIYDVDRDQSGINRDNKAYEVLGGITYKVTELTTLNFGIGGVRREFEDSRLDDAQTLALDASLLWTPTDDFTLNALLNRTNESTTLSGVNDIVVTRGSLVPSLSLTEETIASAELGFAEYEFSNTSFTDHDYFGGFGVNYLWNNAVNTGIRYRYYTRLSDLFNRGFYSNTLLFTLSCSL